MMKSQVSRYSVIAGSVATLLVSSLAKCERLCAMAYDLGAGRKMMNHHNLVTIMLVQIEGDQQSYVRNAFASG